ncbi:ABC transporter ATP-binding protein [Salinicoccus sp. YB14-2]|uniref:ABC transporter ATP-binding protein n=1 Tax=Salinicoccus sp. YB14-2 TaxID=1572701 RepID=UPI0009E28F23|nr:ATP-binding cassette domain-containing protein [Salinicoccus sp. YB14-2]
MFKVSETHQAATWLLHEKVSSNVKKDVDEMTRPDDKDILEEPKKIYEEKLIKVDNLKKYFKAGQKNEVKAIDSISFDIFKGETFGLVGESGCGKSTTGRTLVNLYNPTEGEVFFKGENIKDKNKIELHKQMQMIFQDPYSSLNPRWTVQDIIAEGMDIHGLYSNKKERQNQVKELLETVGLNPSHATRYPHEFCGGQRQRIGIARALAVEPDFIVADEPISALDVSIQAQIINLLKKLQKEKGLTYLFIAHDLSMVKHISDRFGVMYQGRLVEVAESEELYKNPLHPYTKSLLDSIPIPDPKVEKERGDFTKPPENLSDINASLREVWPGHYVAYTDEDYKAYKEKFQEGISIS